MENDVILSKCFDCLVSEGLEKTSVRTICKLTGISASSLYYRWTNRDEIVLEATWYGLKKITTEFFDVAVDNFQNFGTMFHALMRAVTKNKSKMELIYQVVNSPTYSRQMRERLANLTLMYSRYTFLLSDNLKCPEILLEPYVNFAIDTLRSYIIWGNKEQTEQQMQFIYEKIMDMKTNNERKESSNGER